MPNIVAIVGRPNVGKSTFFNRLVKSRQAIVEETAGVTRDRHYGKSDWNGIEFSIIDTGGYVEGSDDVFEEEIRRQVELAIGESDIIIFMVDVKDGLTEMDKDVAQLLRKSRKKIFLAANKVDNTYRTFDVNEFYALGLGQVYGVSSINGSGTGELLDELVKEFKDTVAAEIPDLPKIAVVGRPNVGKSSLINALLGEERHIVTPIAGTTRDTIYTPYNSFGFEFLLVDTAGLRKKGKVTENIEFYSVMRAIRAIEQSDICLLMINAEEGLESQDLNILSLIEKNHKGVVILVNKWDLVEKENNTMRDMEAFIKSRTAPFTDLPVVFTSVTNKQRIFKAMEWARRVYENKYRQVSTSKLNELLLPIIQATPPPQTKGKLVKIKYITQLKMHYPTFAFFCNTPQYIKEPYARFVENKLRENFEFTGVPIQIFFRQK
ncbi:MAG TPA: ribosome biogenesis GTPase Der [Bacteroidales bacterium]|nr:ribosome biogenesis GTPase Der [Bacteroidales bacterium]HOX79057.1 ribosome biogenesis GTPase Der [Bacteroidales bacterium]HPI87401.1 ribosome biogenesis GTPase Der [Bacteroidales bacterium]HPM91997.1 ribosome biogenesis GTPase Der [Bacteroidales bacterium]